MKITKKNDNTEITELLRQILETLQGLKITNNIRIGRDNNGNIILGNNNRSNSATDNVSRDLTQEITV